MNDYSMYRKGRAASSVSMVVVGVIVLCTAMESRDIFQAEEGGQAQCFWVGEGGGSWGAALTFL